jgi:hypothetical protein
MPNGHLAECPHDQEDRCAADRVGQQDGRAGGLDRGSRTVKQPGADRRAEGHEPDVADSQTARESLGKLCHGEREPF